MLRTHLLGTDMIRETCVFTRAIIVIPQVGPFCPSMFFFHVLHASLLAYSSKDHDSALHVLIVMHAHTHIDTHTKVEVMYLDIQFSLGFHTLTQRLVLQ